LALPADLLTARPKRLRFLIFHMPGRLVHHARQLSLRLGTAIEELAMCLDAVRLLPLPQERIPGQVLIDGFAERFLERFGKEPSLGFQMDLTNLHALLNDQKAGSRSELTSHPLAFRLLDTRHQHLTDGLGSMYPS
jgi:hypothetical protein